MKNRILKSAFLLFFVSFSFLSCSEYESVDPALLDLLDQEPTQSGSFSALIDGEPFTATQVVSIYMDISFADAPRIMVSGIRLPNQDNLRVDLSANSTGVYPLDFMDATITYFDLEGETFSSSTIGNNPITGNITITSLDMTNKLISGTFQGIIYNFGQTLSKNITNGVFTNVPFIIHND